MSTEERSRRQTLSKELRQRITDALDAQRDLYEEQQAPRTRRIMEELHPPDDIVDHAYHDIFLGIVQQITNDKGQRIWARYEKRYLPFDPQELEAALTIPDWLKTDDLAGYPDQRAAFIIADQKAIQGRLRKKLYYDEDIQMEILAFLDAKFEQQLARVRKAS